MMASKFTRVVALVRMTFLFTTVCWSTVWVATSRLPQSLEGHRVAECAALHTVPQLSEGSPPPACLSLVPSPAPARRPGDTFVKEREALRASASPFQPLRFPWNCCDVTSGPESPPPRPQVPLPKTGVVTLSPAVDTEALREAMCALFSERALPSQNEGAHEDLPSFGGPQPGGGQSGPGLPPTPASLAFPGTSSSALYSHS